MNATQFLNLIQKADHLEKSDVLQLKKLQEIFPYFQIPHILTARNEFLESEGKSNEHLALAAVISPDRIWLKNLIERPISEVPDKQIDQDDYQAGKPNTESDPENLAWKIDKSKPEAKSQNLAVESSESVKPPSKRRKPPKDDLIETIKRKEKQVIVDAKKQEQIDMIKAFSKKEFKLATIKELEANQQTENLAESSTKLNDNLLSESFAKILIMQGKKAKAVEIYGKLSLKFPEKRTYFADLIEKLKE